MAISELLTKDYKKVVNEKLEISTYLNDNFINSEISKKTYNVYNRELDVYNIKVNIDAYAKNDIISFIVGKNIIFKPYDSDECTYMYTSEDDTNYYIVIGYDTDYFWNTNEFINEKYPYALIEEIKENKFEYSLLDESINYPNSDYYHNINLWLIKINKEEFKDIDREEIYEYISLKLL